MRIFNIILLVYKLAIKKSKNTVSYISKFFKEQKEIRERNKHKATARKILSIYLLGYIERIWNTSVLVGTIFICSVAGVGLYNSTAYKGNYTQEKEFLANKSKELVKTISDKINTADNAFWHMSFTLHRTKGALKSFNIKNKVVGNDMNLKSKNWHCTLKNDHKVTSSILDISCKHRKYEGVITNFSAKCDRRIENGKPNGNKEFIVGDMKVGGIKFKSSCTTEEIKDVK